MSKREAEPVQSKAEDVHVMPNFGRNHRSSSKCWCEPELNYTAPNTGNHVWVHEVGH